MLVAVPVFPEFTALDAVGPYEVLQRVPSLDVVFLGHRRGEVRTDNGMLGVSCDATFDEVARPDVVVFPGGAGTRDLVHDAAVLAWVRAAHAHTRFTTRRSADHHRGRRVQRHRYGVAAGRAAGRSAPAAAA